MLCKAWSLTLREERRLRVPENRILRLIFLPKRDENGEWRNLGLGTSSLKSLPEDLSSGFLLPEKIHRPQSGLNPRTLYLEASTLP